LNRKIQGLKMFIGCRKLILISTLMFASLSYGQGMPPVVQAAKEANWSLLQTLLSQGVEVNAVYGDGSSALHWASYWDDIASANRLINAGSNVNASTDLGATPLWLAAENGSAEMVKVLLTAGADSNATLLTGETIVMNAARSGNANVVRQLLEAGADPNPAVTREQTALMWAASQGHSDVVEALVEYGADVHARTLVRTQFVKTEKPQDSPPAYQMWVEQGGNTALMFAARSGDLRSAQFLVEVGSDVNAVSAFGTSPSIMAVHGGNAELLNYFLASGADPDNAASGHTALHAAVLRGNYDAVKTLLDHDADVEAKVVSATPSRRQSTEYHFHIALAGATPLWLAARFAEPEIMNLLVENGADATTINNVSYPSQRLGEAFVTEEGDISVLMAAVGMGHRRMTVSWGSADRRAGRTHRDRESAILEASVIAVQAGADLNIKNADGQTALDYAKARNYDTVVLYLLGAGARED
jgi:ankyrin repeat protein